MEDNRNANAPGRHPQGIPYKTHGLDSALASTIVDQLIYVQRTISEVIAATKNHGGGIDELFFQTIHRDVDFLVDRLVAFGMDAAAEETGGDE